MGLFSCSDDNETVDNLLPPTIVKVCVWDEDIEEWIIPGAESKIRIGTPLRIEGTNMAQTIAVYINEGRCYRMTDLMDHFIHILWCHKHSI